MITPRLYNEDEIAFMNDDHEAASAHLAQRLLYNELGLFLGGGVSAPLNLPLWGELVKDCCEEVKITDHGIATDPETKKVSPKVPWDELLELMARVRRKYSGDDKEYHELIRNVLYKNIDPALDKSPFMIMQIPLLIAVGSLISGSVNGKVNEVITYNFDGLLEWYLSLHGYKVHAIQEIPCLLDSSDINIFHPHGFLPLDKHWEGSNFIILDKTSYENRFDPFHQNPWWRVLECLLHSKQFLFIGIGESDPTLGVLLNAIKKNFETASAQDRRIIGFWTFHSKYKSDKHEEKINAYGCVPLYFGDYNDIPYFLLKIRQIAAGLILS